MKIFGIQILVNQKQNQQDMSYEALYKSKKRCTKEIDVNLISINKEHSVLNSST